MIPAEAEFRLSSMDHRRQKLRQMLEKPNLKTKQRREIERLIWVMTGMIEHKISIRRLHAVCKTYEAIDLVPQGYMQAELFTLDQESVPM